MACDMQDIPVQQGRHPRLGRTRSLVHQLGMAHRCPGCTPVCPDHWSCNWQPVAAKRWLYRSCHRLRPGQTGCHSQQQEEDNKESAVTKQMIRYSSVAHVVSCMTASGDTQAEVSMLGSPDALDISCAPEKPGRQVQVKLPCVLTQLALAEQPFVCRTHSLMSVSQLGPSKLQVKQTSGKATAVPSVLSATPRNMRLCSSRQTSY